MDIDQKSGGSRRAEIFAALADPTRLAIVDYLLIADASPSELGSIVSMPSNLLAHHIGILKRADVVRQSRSEADGRRTYLKLNQAALDVLVPHADRGAGRVVFVCTRNSARSQLAVAIWNRRSPVRATSAGTHPAVQVHPGAVAAARRHKLPMRPRAPRLLADVLSDDDLVVAVCDNAHEELPAGMQRIHWSIPDPVRASTDAAFDLTLTELTTRIEHFAPCVQPV